MTQEKLKSAQVIVASLVSHGVDCIFGIPGAHTYELIDAIYERRDRIRFIVTRHEQGAALHGVRLCEIHRQDRRL